VRNPGFCSNRITKSSSVIASLWIAPLGNPSFAF
jgi:hypothetical protein